MNATRARKIRQTVRKLIAHDLDAAWECIQHVPWRGRMILAWRLAVGRNMDGTKLEKKR